MSNSLGKDADDMFEDIGHSSEARSKLKEYIVGSLKVKFSSLFIYYISCYKYNHNHCLYLKYF